MMRQGAEEQPARLFLFERQMMMREGIQIGGGRYASSASVGINGGVSLRFKCVSG